MGVLKEIKTKENRVAMPPAGGGADGGARPRGVRGDPRRGRLRLHETAVRESRDYGVI